MNTSEYSCEGKEILNAGTNVLSVICLTYNHAEFLGQAIEGFLMQQTDFEFDVLICDDCSPDNTRQIVLHYIDTHPMGYRIRYFRQKRNIGVGENGLFALRNANSKYIALCEGDDYWTDPSKLQKQFNFLEINPECAAQCHNALVIKNGQSIKEYNAIKTARNLSTVEIITSLEIPTASIMFRNIFRSGIPESYKAVMIDLALFYCISLQGKIHYSPEIMSAYRVHGGGAWTGQGELTKINEAIEINRKLVKYLPLTKVEKRAVITSNVHLRHNRIKSHANRYQFGFEYFKDVGYLIFKKVQGYEVRIKFLTFCMVPNSIVHRLLPHASEKPSANTSNAS